VAITAIGASLRPNRKHATHPTHTEAAAQSKNEPAAITVTATGDTIKLAVAPEHRSGRLTEEDFEEVARELGVEVPAITQPVRVHQVALQEHGAEPR